MSRKPSAAEHLARQSMLSPAVDDDARSLSQRHIKVEDCQTLATFADNMGKVSKGPIDISAFDDFDEQTAQALREAFVLHCLPVRADRRYFIIHSLRTGIFKYFRDAKLFANGYPSLAEIDELTLAGFKRALDDPSSAHYRKAIATRNEYIAVFQLLLKQLQLSPYWQPLLHPKLRLLKNPYPQLAKSVTHTAPMGDRSYDDLYLAAEREIESTMREVRRGWQRMSELEGRSLDLAAAGLKPEACAAYLAQTFDGIPPSRFELGRETVRFTRAVSAQTFQNAERFLYPTLRDLVPFLILTTAIFALNPTVVLNMKLEDFNIRSVLGRRRLRLMPFKPRADRRQRLEITVTDQPSHPGHYLPFIVEWTKRLRLVARSTRFEHHVWLRTAPGRRAAIPLEKVDSSLTDALAQFCDDHHLKRADGAPFRFELRQLRPTALDKVHELSGGDINVVQAVANHASARTTEEFYQTAGWVMRNEERLSHALNLRTRDLQGGKFTSLDRSATLDAGAATPGFTCLDPYDSPIVTETSGRLCAAYGMCPACPLGMVDYRSPESCAYLHLLRDRIDDAQVTIGGLAWLTKWAPVKSALLLHLANFDATVEGQARAVSTTQLPELD